MNIKLYRYFEKLEGKDISREKLFGIFETLQDKGFKVIEDNFKFFIIDEKNNTMNKITFLRKNNSYKIYQ